MSARSAYRAHWEDWANDIAKIACTHIDRITALLKNPRNTRECKAFASFAQELRDDLNDNITDADIIEMLAQHLITKPVFDALFDQYSFASKNPMSIAMQSVLDVLQEQHLEKETDTLKGFYDSVRMRAEGIESAAGKQKIVMELYDKFFKNAFPRMTDRLGIVYTPVEVVDFIIQSVAHILQEEFGETLGSPGVHIIDPFTGTGTFIISTGLSTVMSNCATPYPLVHQIDGALWTVYPFASRATIYAAVGVASSNTPYTPACNLPPGTSTALVDRDGNEDLLVVPFDQQRYRTGFAHDCIP